MRQRVRGSERELTRGCAAQRQQKSRHEAVHNHCWKHTQKITSRDSPAECRCSRARQTLTTGKMAEGIFLLSLSQRKVHFQPRGTTVSLCGRSGATVCVCVCVDPVHEIPRELPHSAIICHFSGWLVTFVRFFLKFFVFGFSECEQ